MPSQFISADALDDEDQFELLSDAKRRLPSGSDASDLEDFSTKKPRTKKQKKGRLDGVHTDRTENEKGGIDSSPEGAMANFQSASSKPAISTGSNPKLPSTSNKKDRPIPQTASKDATRAKKKKDKKGKGKAKADTKVLAPLAELGPLELAPGEETSIGLQPPDLQLSYLSDRQKRALPKLSDLELQPLRFYESWLQDLSDKPHRAQLGSWLNARAIPNLLEALKVNTEVPGAPIVLVITSAALRAVDLCRQVKPLLPSPKTTGGVSKLFARHFKLAQHITHLTSTPVAIGVGTPDRIAKLIEAKALKLDRLRWIVLDTTWVDTKSYSLADHPDASLRLALWQGILGSDDVLAMLEQRQLKLALF